MMTNEKFNEFNKNNWNKLIKSNKPFSNTSLPEYGPYMANEEKLQLFKDVRNKKVLELGCASGKSLKFLANQGAKEVWGIDISDEQIKKAKTMQLTNSYFFVSPMEKNPGIPLDYFDYVLSLYSIGYSCDLIKVLELSNDYLKKGGKFILCWTHPFFNCLEVENDKIFVNHSYNDETMQIIKKGSNEIELFQYNLKISTLINGLISAGFEIENVIEENPTIKNGIGNYKSPFFDEKKLQVAPTTLIIVANKK